MQQACRDDPLLAVITPVINLVECCTGEDLGCMREIQSALFERAIAFGRIEGDAHLLYIR